jgi:prevent-host-death family protein
MRTITHRELRNASAEVLRAVEAGETIQVSNKGRVVAVISPAAISAVDRLIAEGKARPALRPLTDLKDIKPKKSPVTSEEILAEIRGPW